MLREITGKREETLKFPNTRPPTINTILKQLIKEYGKDFNEYVYDSRTGEVKSFLQFLVNGRSVAEPKGLDTTLSDGDVLAIIPPVGGG
jgi:MoaD family protein